jgi:PAS domain S-box-containing protein
MVKSVGFSIPARLLIPIKRWKYQLLLGFGLFLGINTYGQQKILQFKHLSIDDGLSSSIVRSVLQDYKGLIWFGTIDGLNRYDGTKIVIYKTITSDSGSLPDNQVRALFEDHNKRLFIGTVGGLSEYNRDLDCFINYRYEKSSPLFNMPLSVFKIVEDSLGNLWLATNDGLIHFDRNKNKIVQYKNDPSNPGSISSNSSDCIYIDKSGRFWIGTRRGLNLFNRTTGAFEHITRCKTHDENIADICFLDIIEDSLGNVWFGSDAGLFFLEKRIDNEKMVLSHFQHNPLDNNSLSNDFTKTLLIDHLGNLWIGTENGGINLFNSQNKSFFHYRIDEFNSMSLNNESIHAMVEDRSKNLWMGTWGGGVNMASNNSGFILHYKHLPGAPQSLSFNIVSDFVEDRFGRIWVSTDGGGLNLFNESTGQFSRFNSAGDTINVDAINCMTQGTNNDIWIGTWEQGLLRFNYLENKVTSLTTRNSNIPDNTFYSIAQDSNGNLWMGSYRHGLVHYQINDHKFSTYAPKQINIMNNGINVVKIDHKGRIYLGANYGSEIFIYIPDENRFVAYSIMPDTSIKGNNSVFDILIETDTCVWAATKKGLYRFNPLNGNHTWFFRENRATETSVKGLTLDKAGTLWVTTNAGIYRFDYRTNAIKQFTASDGLQSNDFYRASMLTTKTGRILAGGSNGFNLLTPDNYSENRSPPSVVITDFHIFNRKVTPGAKGSPLKKQISETKKLTLSYKQSVLSFYFAVLDFSKPDKNQYAYQMENFDKGWIYCGNRKDATYTNLNPGTYFFHVKGANNDGVWNETGVTLELVITPPWWGSKTARAGLTVIIMVFLFGVYFYFRNKQEQKHLREVMASQKKTEDIMQSIDEAIFTINEDMTINSEHSKITEKIFGTAEFEKQDIASLFNMDKKTSVAFAQWLKMAFQRSSSPSGWEEILQLNPIKEIFVERDGTFFLRVHYQPIYENGALFRVMVIIHDITQQKMAEQYEQLSSLLQATLESTADGILVVDLAGHVTSSNKIFGKLWQVPGHVIDIGDDSKIFSYIGEQLTDRDKFLGRVKEIYSQPQRESFDILEFRDGRVFESHSRPQQINDKIVGRVWSFHDITERKKTEAVLMNAQKLTSLGVLAGGIAHDFNNLLTGIFGYIDLARFVSKDEAITEYLNATLATLGRAKALTMQLLTFAKGGSPVQKIMPVISTIKEAAQFALSGSNILCRFDLPDTLWPCNIDKNQIGQVIDNIVINAQQAMPNGGSIEIAAQNISFKETGFPPLTQGDYVKVSISDSGIGISPEVLPRIFDPFYTTKTKGHGLGLATCYSIINRHGGYIDVESKPGKGSTFHVYLPASRESVVLEATLNEKHRGSGTIIVVDDEEVVRNTLGKMLESMGYSVVRKNDGRAAIDFYRNETKAGHAFTAMIFDLTIPGGMGGIEAAMEIRKTDTKIAIFVASGYADDLALKNPGEYGFTASVSKPFTIAELSQMLNKNLSRCSTSGSHHVG